MSRFLSLQHTQRLALAVIMAFTLSVMASAQNLDQIYQTIKNLEGNFPLPTPRGTVNVGSFNAANGNFTGLVSHNVTLPPGEPGDNKPQHDQLPPVAEVNAVAVELTFAVTNSAGDFHVTANGISATAAPGQNSLTVNVGNAYEINWTVQSGSKTYSDTLVIHRPHIVGAGAFTIPALPIAVIYEPPPDSQQQNRATYAVTRTVGSSIKMSFSRESSTTGDAVPSQFSDISTLKNSMNALATLISHAPGVPYAASIASGLNLIAGGLGSASATENHGEINATDHSLNLTKMIGTMINTGANDGGPGVGDIVYYLKNARVVWMADNGKLTLALLDPGIISTVAVKDLTANLNNGWQGLDRDTIMALLYLDPFVIFGKRLAITGSQPYLPESRFGEPQTFEVSGANVTQTFFTSVSESNRHTSTNYSIKIEEYRSGWLSFLGIGVTEDQTLKTVVTQSNSAEETTTDTQQVSVDFHAQTGEVYDVEVYYDSLFGTFAFKRVKPLSQALVYGTAQDSNGHSLPNQLVTLLIGKRKYSTRTDAQGHYSFHAPTIKPGVGTLVIGNQRKGIQITGPGTAQR